MLATAGAASAHIVTGIDISCQAVTVHFEYFPDDAIPVTVAVGFGYLAPIKQVLNVSDAETDSVDISGITSHFAGKTRTITVDITWVLDGDNHVHQEHSVTCGSKPTTTTSTSTTTTSTTTTSTTTTTTPVTPPTPDIFQVELRRCTQVHTGYENFPAGTVIHWRVSQDSKLISTGQFSALGTSGYHFITQLLGSRLQSAPLNGQVRYSWVINGVASHYTVTRAPGCTGVTSTGVSGVGDIFDIDLRQCTLLHVGYQYFPANTQIVYAIRRNNTLKALGEITTVSGSGYHFLMKNLGTTLPSGRTEAITFYWRIKGPFLRYTVTKNPGC